MSKRFEVRFVVDGVVGKGRPRAARRGKATILYTPRKTVEWEDLVRAAAIAALGEREVPKDKYITVHIGVLFQIPRSLSKAKKAALLKSKCTKKPDIDNVIKSVLDGASGVLWKDDAEITCVAAFKAWTDGGSCVSVLAEWTDYPPWWEPEPSTDQ